MATPTPPTTDETARDWSVVALLASVFASAAAALAQGTMLGKQVYDLAGRELDLGLLGLAEFAPAALLVLVTGSAAWGRWPSPAVGGSSSATPKVDQFPSGTGP